MELSENICTLIELMPCAAIIYDTEKGTVIASNTHSEKALNLHVGSTYKDIEATAENESAVRKIHLAAKAELKNNNKCELKNIITNSKDNKFKRCDINISYVDDEKKAVYVLFSRSEHEIELMSQQKIYYDEISSASYSYPFCLDIKSKTIQLYDPEIEKCNMSMVMENFPEQVLKSGYVYEEDIDVYLSVIERMYKGEPPEGSFRFYDPKGELHTYTVNYVVYRDTLGEPVEITGDFVIQSAEKTNTMNEIYHNENALPQQKVVLAHQIKAHFFFNTLNTISALCKQDAIKADNAIMTFATYMRAYMYLISEDDNIEFNQELVLVKSTLEIEKLRFPDNFTYELDLRETDFDIPPLTIQPIVENALLHGLRRTGRHGNLKISSCRKGDMVQIIVSDNGFGFDTSILKNTKSIGLKNLTKRIEIMSEGTVTINSEHGKGTDVIIEIPICNEI